MAAESIITLPFLPNALSHIAEQHSTAQCLSLQTTEEVAKASMTLPSGEARTQVEELN